jgi:hypothetical protein
MKNKPPTNITTNIDGILAYTVNEPNNANDEMCDGCNYIHVETHELLKNEIIDMSRVNIMKYFME